MNWTRAEQVSFAFSGDTCTTLMPFYAGRSLQSKDGRVRLGVCEGGWVCMRVGLGVCMHATGWRVSVILASRN
jgi:hypothetical protein